MSHRDAAELHGLPLRGRRGTVDVTTKRDRVDRSGLTLHRVRSLDAADVTTIRGIPVTTVARTVIDLADVLSPAELRRVIHETEVQDRFDLDAVEAAMRRANGRNLRAIAAAIDEHRPRPKRDIERRLERIAWRAGLRGAHPNIRTLVDDEEFELDRYYPHLRLCLEADGYGVHRTRRKFNSDRRRDRILKLRLGITTFRYTWDDVPSASRKAKPSWRRTQTISAPRGELRRRATREDMVPHDAVRDLVETILRTSLMLSGVFCDLIEDLPEDAFPDEDAGEVLLEMLIGTITPAAAAAGPRAVAQTVALLGAIGDRTIDDLRAAAVLAASQTGSE